MKERAAKRLKMLGWAIGSAIGIFVLGFALFVRSIDGDSANSIAEPADGIVALTGGESRIAQALKLLAQGKGRRLLITGVYPATNRRALKKIAPKHGLLFECCIDIDHAALNTIGNAKAVRDWATAKDFKSVIVVTSSYHMLRSLIELRSALPGFKLVAYPVMSKKFRSDGWWAHPGTMRFLLSEYLKLIPAVARFGVSELGRAMMPGAATRSGPNRSPS